MKKPFARKGRRDRSGVQCPRVSVPPRPVEGAGAFAKKRCKSQSTCLAISGLVGASSIVLREPKKMYYILYYRRTAMAPLSVRLKPKTEAQLDAYCERTGLTRTQVVE